MSKERPHRRRETRAQREARLEREAEARAERAAQARAARGERMRNANIEDMAAEMEAWRASIGDAPFSAEIPIMPLGVDAKVTSDFDAPRRYGIHSSLDFAPAIATTEPVPVLSAVSGRVLFIGEWDPDSGQTVFVGGDDGLIYSYCHVWPGSFTVRPGDRVRQGQPIAIMGSSGEGDGPHLHYVVRVPPENMMQYASFGAISEDPIGDILGNLAQSGNPALRDFKQYERARLVTGEGAEPRTTQVIAAGAPLLPMRATTPAGPVPYLSLPAVDEARAAGQRILNPSDTPSIPQGPMQGRDAPVAGIGNR